MEEDKYHRPGLAAEKNLFDFLTQSPDLSQSQPRPYVYMYHVLSVQLSTKQDFLWRKYCLFNWKLQANVVFKQEWLRITRVKRKFEKKIVSNLGLTYSHYAKRYMSNGMIHIQRSFCSSRRVLSISSDWLKVAFLDARSSEGRYIALWKVIVRWSSTVRCICL